MAEYIERDEAIKRAIDACIKVAGHCITQFEAVDIAEAIESIPTADVVEVVRCENCQRNGGVFNGGVYCDLHKVWMDEKAFCSYGKRKEGNNGNGAKD